MPSTVTILRAVNSAYTPKFGHFLGALGEAKPPVGDHKGWRELLESLSALEAMELITLTRDNRDDIQTAQLTELGKERLREAMEEEAADRRRVAEVKESSVAKFYNRPARGRR